MNEGRLQGGEKRRQLPRVGTKTGSPGPPHSAHTLGAGHSRGLGWLQAHARPAAEGSRAGLRGAWTLRHRGWGRQKGFHGDRAAGWNPRLSPPHPTKPRDYGGKESPGLSCPRAQDSAFPGLLGPTGLPSQRQSPAAGPPSQCDSSGLLAVRGGAAGGHCTWPAPPGGPPRPARRRPFSCKFTGSYGSCQAGD